MKRIAQKTQALLAFDTEKRRPKIKQIGKGSFWRTPYAPTKSEASNENRYAAHP